MNRKPRIGINSDFRTSKGDAPDYLCVTSGYFDCIIKVGGIPVVVPPLENETDIECVLEDLDGFLLIGGHDLDPRHDGFMIHPTVRPLDSRRETFDRMLVQCIANLRLPVFGIGVGMQLLNVTQGGNLFLHVPEDLPDSIPHRDLQDPGHRHSLDIVPGTILERVFGDGEIRVNSKHHMAVDEVAPGFMVTARCPDGVIEAIESEIVDWFAIGTQFHPESSAASALDVRIFEEFIDGIKAGKHSLQLVA
ncbi:MAG: gamma-glutamyl-gamma-aminobutyrate hydrolase family protein [Pirellulaceae bacterium]|nr:gamma-glutamyl-gamma-aminobutyrate hydrolase family protein [Pirellulaceae bacterium]